MIRNFEDIVEKFQLSRDTLQNINKRLSESMNIEPSEVKFTALQNAAFNREGFWLSQKNSIRHVIIQGATSSGKTLVSELAILDSLKNGNKKSLVLVPLRAMVRERHDQLREDFSAQGIEKVYASSSDFQDHDGEIIQGDFEVAVIVYEKFFAMLSQSQFKATNGKDIPMLNDCALLVVDELQMLNSQERGPKLEIAIQKVLENNKLDNKDLKTRIMCLTTCDCKVGQIEKWLTVDDGTEKGLKPILIQSNARPAGLSEHVIELNGKYRVRHTYGENSDKKLQDGEEQSSGELKVTAALRNREGDKKNALLKALLLKIYRENPNAKVLVYVNGRRGTRRVAEFVASEGLLPVEEMSERMKRIEEFDEDDYTKILREKLLPRRIAFHNASLSYPLRELIEELFCDNEDPLRLVVATETLTIGMNMPVDVMILYDSQTTRFEGRVSLTNQEYKNFVGRAGRLGNRSKNTGESYIFAEDGQKGNYFWDNYVYYRAEEIKSALANVEEENQAPYYLNLLRRFGRKRFTLENFEQLLKESFAQKCSARKFDTKKICAALVKAKLCEMENDDDYFDLDEEEEVYYRLNEFGENISPYALHLETCKLIRRYFYNHLYMKKKLGIKKKRRGEGGLPTNATADDLEKYSLDILYRLCCTPEIERIGQLEIPQPNQYDNYRKVCTTIEKTLRRMVESGDCQLWEDSPIANMLSSDYQWTNEREDKKHLLRAILLWYWTKGYDLSEIRRETGFRFATIAIVQEDIARIAETVAYLLEAISNCLIVAQHAGFEKLNSGDIYRFSTCVNYGMPRNLVVIANKHVRTLDRRTILKLGKLWESKKLRYESPEQMLLMSNERDLAEIRKIISEEERKEIILRLEESTLHDSYDILLETIRTESNLSESAYTAIQNLYDTNTNENSANLLQPLTNLFSPAEEPVFKGAIEFSVPIFEDENFLQVTSGEKIFTFIAYNDKEESKVDFQRYRRWLEKNPSPNRRIILVVSTEGKFSRVQWRDRLGKFCDAEGEVLLENVSVAITFKQFAYLLVQAIKVKDTDARALTSLLWDVAENFPPISLSTMGMMLKNYEITEVKDYLEGSPDLPTLRIVCDKRNHVAYNELLEHLKRQKISYRVVSWGEGLYSENVRENFYLIYLDWNMAQKMDSLKTFCAYLKKTGYNKTFAIFDSESNFREWGGNPEHAVESLSHIETTKKFNVDVPNKIKPFLQMKRDEKFLIGVSYSTDSDGLDLLDKFVDELKAAFPEEKIFYDEYPTAHNLLQGQGGADRNGKYYKDSEFFLVLDDPTYNEASDPCNNEFTAITERLAELPKIEESRLWFLHLPGKKHCAYFRKGHDYETALTAETLSETAAKFIKLVRDNLREAKT